MKKSLCLLFSVLLVSMLLCGCNMSNAEDNTDSKKTEVTGPASADVDLSTFTVALAAEPDSFDPIHNYSQTSFCVVNNVYDSLLNFGKKGELEPCLASSWKQVDDQTYVYEIRDDVYFQDGTQMTVDDVVFSLQRYQDPSYAADTNWMYLSVASIEATGDWEVTVKLSAPDSCWQYVPATSAGQIISKAYYEKHKDDYGTFTGGAMGTGAYGLDTWTSNSEILLKKNKYYWNKEDNLLFDTVAFKIIPDSSSRALAANSGQVDLIMKVESTELDQYDATAMDICSTKGTNISYGAMNTSRAPFNDINFRKAVDCAIDKQALKEAVIGEYGDDATGLFFNDTLFSMDKDAWSKLAQDTADDYSFDLNKAKDYLSKSAYPDGYNITYVCKEGTTAAAQIIQASLKQLNINVTIIEAQTSDYYAYSYGMKTDTDGNRDYDMFEFIWYSDFPDPAGTMMPLLMSVNACEGGCNMAVYKNDQVDQLFADQTAITDVKKRSGDLLQISSLENSDCAYIKYYYDNNNYVINPKYTYDLSPMWLYNYRIKDVKLK